jgi:small-conductance mechanosensitive channel
LEEGRGAFSKTQIFGYSILISRWLTISIFFTVWVYVQHELRHRIFERFKKEGGEIPFPQRTVHLRKEGI